MTRRRMLGVTGGALAAALLAGCSPGNSGGAGTTASSSTSPTAGATGQRLEGVRGVVFNTGSQDVTLFDPASNKVTGSRPTNAVVRWLSNEQRYWDGESIWTYDFPED